MVTAVPDSFIKDIEGFLHDTRFSDFCKTPIDRLAREFLSVERSQEQVRELKRFAPITPTSRVLEVGSGFGTFVYFCRANGICEAQGLEPGLPPYSATLDISRRLLASADIPATAIDEGIGESMPYPDASFDAVYSVSCLEHTQDPGAVLKEIVRVLKPGGVAVINFPNYGSWWEGHYNFFMVPHTPKWLFKIIARLRGRSPDFADTLQFITYGKLMGWLRPLQEKVDIVSTGQEIFRERVTGLQFSEWNGLQSVKRAAQIVKQLKLDTLLVKVGTWLHWETPFVLVLRRKG